jgi:NitT/TauT family transport system substrate-binding protein
MRTRFSPLSQWPRRRLVAWAAVAWLLLGACSGGGAGSGREGVRIGVNLWVGYDLLAVAEDLGWFAEEGFDVEIVDLGALSDVTAAFERGYIDGMATSLLDLIQVRSETDLNPVAVLITDYSDGADVVVAKRGITSIAGLAGAQIAADGPLGIYLLSRALSREGLALGDVDVVWTSQPDISALAWSGHIDAAVTFPPVSTELTHRLGYNTLFSSAQIPRQVLDVVSFGEQFIRDHPEAVRAILRVWDRALGHLSEHPREAVEAIAAREGLDAAKVEEALARVKLLTLDEQAELFQREPPAGTCLRAAWVIAQAPFIFITETHTALGCASSEFIISVLEARR